MASRTLSFQQWVLDADPFWQRDRTRPWVYEFSNGRLFYLNPNVYAPTPTIGLANDGGVLMLLDPTGYPVSFVGLPIGGLWNNGLTIGVAGVTTPNPVAPALFFPGVTAASLLAVGGANLPLSPSGLATGQLWNNGGTVSVR